MARRTRRPGPDLELHVMVDRQVVIGPVQASLLEAIRTTGSIAAAQRQIGASYSCVEACRNDERSVCSASG